MKKLLILMAVVIGTAVPAGGTCTHPSAGKVTPPHTQPTGETENAAAAMLTFLGYRMWMSTAEVRARIGAEKFLVVSDSEGWIEATGEYAGCPARFEWGFTHSGNLRSFQINLDYDGTESPQLSPFHPVVRRALDAQHPAEDCATDEPCEWVLGDDRVILSANRIWPKGLREPLCEWRIDMVSQSEEPDPDPAVVLNQRLSAAGSTAEKWLETAGIDAPVSPTMCLDLLAKSAPDRALAVAKCLEQACTREDVAAILDCLADCPAAPPSEPDTPVKVPSQPKPRK